ncbi:autoinducer 2 ABC transporter substrate-binding protein [Meiothermus granaticius]|uniref:Autoinducer 2-binding protein LsrB n=1 Tax=Meiothermus granaticius NBRC 107808 TaxID=1227551 RepID=A0A399FA62_9DEIN|nr:autoinducer 2 ABC transporter substrate-binding protein [Meiothermus granaticius]MCL6528440.1 autoinducer 2 ABC transporter substrate-binding protein [Thermaceae bacterium]RIH92605.1 Autoinducer 2-binding protein LsrB [Meiothermus granaticius NBRC 107808]GEM87977.1 autoinducer 2 ABC transporter substrate-binding protein [Meiothermus granaticius NBRC 107808]
MKRKTLWIAAGLAALAVGVTGLVLAQKKYTIVTVVKITGINWFNRMEEGVKEYAKETGNNAYQTGPAQADAAQQLKLIQDLVAKKPDAIAVVPFDPAVLEPVLKQALERGIKVITHEADNQVNTLYDIEAFDNVAFGARLNERLAKCMGYSGKWTVFVGSLGSKTHNQWADGGIANAKKYSGMQLVDAKQETADDAEKAYQKAKEILKKYPDIKGFQGSASTDVAGIGRAIEEAGLNDKVCVFGTSLPSIAGKYIETGAVDGIGFWDPKDAGIVMNKVAQMVLEGKKITDGMNLGVKGYEKVSVTKGPGQGFIIRGNAFVDVDKSNLKDYNF